MEPPDERFRPEPRGTGEAGALEVAEDEPADRVPNRFEVFHRRNRWARGGTKAQCCSRIALRRPSVSRSPCRSVRCLCESGGGIRSSSSSLRIR